MIIGILKLFIFIPGSNSLKEKRMVLNSLKQRLRNNFNVSVAQIDDEVKWQKATLAVVGVGKSSANISSIFSSVVNFIENFKRVDLINYETELI